MHHAALNGAGPHDGHLNHQVVKTRGLEARQHAHLRAAFNLEHANGVGAADHGVGGRVFGGHIGQPKRPAHAGAEQIERLAQGREHAQREHIHLEQAQGIEVVLVPLDDGAVFHGGVFDRHQARQRAPREHKATHVLRAVARKANQLGRKFQPLAHRKRLCVEAQLGQGLFAHGHAIPPAVRLGQMVNLRGRKPQGLAHIADGRLWPVCGNHRR